MILPAQQADIAATLARMPNIPAGIGTTENACSIAAINLALTGKLADDIPECMSLVIGRWIITTQDAMPASMRNSAEWRALLPLAAGTGRDPAREQARLAVLLGWMWGVVLPRVQPAADAGGYGDAWHRMCVERTKGAAASTSGRLRASSALTVASISSTRSGGDGSRTASRARRRSPPRRPARAPPMRCSPSCNRARRNCFRI